MMKKLTRIISRLCVIALTLFYLPWIWWIEKCLPRRKRVLIVAPLRLGDFGMFLPTAADLISYFRDQGFKITLLITPGLEKLANFPDVEEILYHPYPANAVNPVAACRLYRQISRRKFQIAVAMVTERSFFHDDLPLLYAGASKVYLPQAVKLPERFWWRLPFWMDKLIFRTAIALPEYVSTPEMANYARLTAQITGREVVYRKPELLLAENNLFAGKYILFAPGSQDISRSLAENISVRVIAHLCRNHNVVIAGTAGEFERAEKLRHGNEQRCFNFCGKSDLPMLLRLIADAEAVIGTDSGIANLALLSGKKIAVLQSQAHDRFMFIPPEAGKAGFTAPQLCRKKELCAYRNCNWVCCYRENGKTYPCLDVPVENFIAVIDQVLEG